MNSNSSCKKEVALRFNLVRLLLAAVVLGCAATSMARAGDTRANYTSPVISLREFELKRGVKPEEFEAFARKELAHALSTEQPGTRLRVLKGDRGDRKGRYILLWEFESVAARNECFPREGAGSSATFKPAWKRMKLTLEKFSRFVREKEDYTDYVAVTD